MKHLKRLLTGNWAGVFSLGIGTILAQSISLLIQPILTRLYTPDELGVYTLVISLATLVIPVASLKLDTLIVIVGNDSDAEVLTDASILSVIWVSFVYAIIVLLLINLPYNPFNKIGYISIFIPIIVLTNGIRFIFVSHNNRFSNYHLISKVSVIRESFMSIFQVLLSKFGFVGLIIAYCTAPLVGVRVQSKAYVQKLLKRKFINVRQLLNIYQINKNHILYLVPSQFINTFSYTLITLSVITLFSTQEAGYYSVSVRVLGIPLILISNNFSRVFIQKFSNNIKNDKSAWKIYISAVRILSLISLVGFFTLTITAPMFANKVFGDGYQEAGIYISILTFMYAMRFIASSLIGIFVVFNKQRYEFGFNLLLVVLGIVGYYIVKYMQIEIYDYFKYISISYGIVYLSIVVTLGFLCKKNDFILYNKIKISR